MPTKAIKDSGQRREFTGGSVRDIQEGKGRCDLLPLREVEEFFAYLPEGEAKSTLDALATFEETLDKRGILQAMIEFCTANRWSRETAILEVAIHYEEGAKKYAENNWRKVGGGIPVHCYLDSAIRHYLKWKRGDSDEPHDRAVIWNLLGLLWTLNNLAGTEFDDLDYYKALKASKEKKSEPKKSGK